MRAVAAAMDDFKIETILAWRSLGMLVRYKTGTKMQLILNGFRARKE